MNRTTLADRNESARLRDLFEERAGILEFQGGFSRVEAETRAQREVGSLDPSAAGGAL